MVYRRTGAGEAKREASIARIVGAAHKLFAEKGFEATTMQDIVSEADSSIGNLYFYFKNKEDLLQHLVEQSLLEGYKLGDDAAARVPVGPARLAIVMFANAARIWGPEASTANMVGHLGDQPFAIAMMKKNTDRIRHYLAENIPDLHGIELDYAAAAWGVGGVAIAAVWQSEPAQADRIWQAAEFAVRWNLRAVGVSDPDIADAIATARRTLNV